MKQKLKRAIYRTHHWRDVGFDELSELYISILLRSLGLSLIGIFIPIYLYQLGYSVSDIVGLYVVFAATRPLLNYAAGRSIGYFGPKHTMLLSVVALLGFLGLLLSIGRFDWSLWLVGVTMSVSMALYFTALHTDFSKVSHVNHSGKEIGYLQVAQRVGTAIGPILGGVVAQVFGADVTIWAAFVLLSASIIPLSMSAEQTPVRQTKISLRLHWTSELRRALFLHACINIHRNFINTLWPLYLALTVFADKPYIGVGIVSGVSLGVSILTSLTVGAVSDKKQGPRLMRYGGVANALVGMTRPFITTPVGAVLHNVMHEQAQTAVELPTMKGFYSLADRSEAERIGFIVIAESVIMLVRLAALLVVLWALQHYPAVDVLKWTLFAVSFASLSVFSERFRALRA